MRIKIFMKDEIWKRMHGSIPKGMKVSHRNGNPLDNTRKNLYLVPLSEYPGDQNQVYRFKEIDWFNN